MVDRLKELIKYKGYQVSYQFNLVLFSKHMSPLHFQTDLGDVFIVVGSTYRVELVLQSLPEVIDATVML